MRTMNPEKETKKIVNFIKETFKNKGFSRAVIGISGGIDSAVVTALLVLALGKENVYGYSLPYGDQWDINDAKLVSIKYGISYSTINIKKVVDCFLDTLGYEVSDPKSVGNIKARTRMIMLYDRSAFYNALVVGTSNKTELSLGYFTLYGDGACALEPIGHLYKTEVFKLAEYLGVPKQIINKAPSAGLWEGQTDEVELGYTYERLDNVLEFINYEKLTIKDSPCFRGADDNFKIVLEDILNRIERNKFKLESPTMLEY